MATHATNVPCPHCKKGLIMADITITEEKWDGFVGPRASPPVLHIDVVFYCNKEGKIEKFFMLGLLPVIVILHNLEVIPALSTGHRVQARSLKFPKLIVPNSLHSLLRVKKLLPTNKASSTLWKNCY